jgi:hypothetical protein
MAMNALYLLPVIALAQSGPANNFGYIGEFFNGITAFIGSTLIPLVFAVALLMFLYGMYLYFIQGGASDDSRQKGQQLALWAIIGFVLMVSIWAIVNLVAGGLFPGGGGSAPTLPGTPTI